MFNKKRNKGKKYFCKTCLECFSGENVLLENKKDCLLINNGQNVKLEKGVIEFKNFNRQIPVPFKIYADFECLLKSCDVAVDNDCFSYTRKYQDHIPCSFAYKVVCVDNKFSKDVVLYRGKNAVSKFIKCIFKEYDYCRSVMKKHFNKNVVMTAEEYEEFDRSKFVGKLIDLDDNKVRDHCHITGKCRGSAHWSCNINLKISKKVPAIFHNLKGYDFFEKFVRVCLKDYGLDSCHYFSSYGLSWDAMLKMTGIQLEKTNNIDVHLFVEKGVRGGVSYISKRYSESDENTEIMY